jgi:hypothetical protein
MVLPETVVVGKPEPESRTSISADLAAEQDREIPGGYTVKTNSEMNKGRAFASEYTRSFHPKRKWHRDVQNLHPLLGYRIRSNDLK